MVAALVPFGEYNQAPSTGAPLAETLPYSVLRRTGLGRAEAGCLDVAPGHVLGDADNYEAVLDSSHHVELTDAVFVPSERITLPM